MYKIKLTPFANIFYTEWVLNPDSFRYNVSYVQLLYGKLDVSRLRNALIRYVNDHLLLNSHIQECNGEPYWVKNTTIRELEYFNYPIDDAELLKYVTNKFDLYSEPLYKFRLIRINDDSYKFVIVFNHIVLDGSSFDAGIIDAISNYYNTENYVSKYSIDEQINLNINLTTTLSVELEKNKNRNEKFWRQQLSSTESIDLNFLKLNRKNNTEYCIERYNPIAEIKFSYGNDEVIKLNQLKLQYSVTPYIYGQCILALLLYRYTGQEQLAIAYPIAIKEGIDFIYGAQLNINLAPYKFSRNMTIKELFDQSRRFFNAIKQKETNYGYYPITELFSADNKIIDNRRLLDLSFIQAPFRDKLFTFDGIDKAEALSELNVDSVPKEMLLFEQEIKLRNGNLNYRVRYDKRTLDSGLVNNFVHAYQKLFLEILEDVLAGSSDKAIVNYSILDAKQYHKIVYEFNQTTKDYPRDKTIHQLFEEQVLKTPDNIAVVYEEKKLTYQELNQKANRLAHYLLDKYAIKPDKLVALCLNRNEYMLIAMLAVLKAGGAYVPIEPSYPDARIKYICDDSNAKVIIINAEHENKLSQILNKQDKAIEILVVENKEINKIKKISNPITNVTSQNLIYVIYTSGTTGNPKGVMIKHSNVINFLMAIQLLFKVCDKDKFLASTALTFDIAGLEIYLPLFNGAQIIIINSEELLNIKLLMYFIENTGITYMQATPSLWSVLVRFKWKGAKGLTILAGGEKLSLELANALIANGSILWNLYGPTETTIWSTAYKFKKGSKPYIGKPIANTKVLVLDKNKDLIPVGVTGELYIAGDGLALGYLNQEKLTKEKFIINPFQTAEEKTKNKNNLLYKTGDLVKMLPNGNLEYIERNDFLVKLRGFRIELGEIENKLLAYPDIKQVAVLVNGGTKVSPLQQTDKYIVAYYVADQKLNEVEIYDYLIDQLPDYMLPSILIYLKKLPLTSNGKLDRAALPIPKFVTNERYVKPKSEAEKTICLAFVSVLKIKKVGINDDFFKLGGNSLKAITLTSILQTNFDVNVAHIFNLRTPCKLAANLHIRKDVIAKNLKQIEMLYADKLNRKSSLDKKAADKMTNYLKNIENLQLTNPARKSMVNVLLTGATGFLGCNLLNQLLKHTDYIIYLPVRASSHAEAVDKINKKFKFYFDEELGLDSGPRLREGGNDKEGGGNCNGGGETPRVIVFAADLEKTNLGLSAQEYQELAYNIDSTIHAAALVKHYGDYDQFYATNVQATINLLEFTKLTALKDFHYISTSSVLNCGFIPDHDEYIYTEDDFPLNTQQHNNVYVQTKFYGEQQVVEYRKYGINSNIYRVGNLAFIAENGRVQENVDDNAFLNCLKCLIKLQCIPKELSIVEISPVDMTAQAIVKIFDKKLLNNNVYHLINPNFVDLSQITLPEGNMKIKVLPLPNFINKVVYNLNGHYNELVLKFLLHQGWLDGPSVENTTVITILQNRTTHILNQLGFEWMPIVNVVFNKLVQL